MEHLYRGDRFNQNTCWRRFPLGHVSQSLRRPSDLFNTSPTIRHPAATCEYILITIFMIIQLNSVYFGFASIRSRSTIYKSVKLDKNCSSPIQCMSLFPPKRISTACPLSTKPVPHSFTPVAADQSIISYVPRLILYSKPRTTIHSFREGRFHWHFPIKPSR